MGDYADPVWHIFAVFTDRRDVLEKRLNDSGIGTTIHYPIPMHLQGAYADWNIIEGSFPIAEKIASTEISLPMFYGMTQEQVDYVCRVINEMNLID